MARRGGASTLSGVDYQILYTVKRFAEAITEDSITVLRPEAHLPGQTVTVNNADTEAISDAPSVDDLTLTHQKGLTEYISLKHRAGQAVWTITQLINRDILDDFFRQHQQDARGMLRLVTQSPIEQALRDCVERANQVQPETLPSLGKAPLEIYQRIATHLRQYYSEVSTTDANIIAFLRQIDFPEQSADLLIENILLRLQPQAKDAQATMNVLYQYAMRAGKEQLVVTPETIRQELIHQHHALIVPPQQDEVLAQFKAVSATLNAVPANIGNLPGHHISRSEVAKLIDWVVAPLPALQLNESKTARTSRIVIGGAGVGKTVVLRDVYQELTQRHIPVLALIADRIKGETKGRLLDDIRANGLQFPLRQALAIVASPERPAVILVDQLDALSMCLGAERGLLISYTELLNELQQLPHIRFILSCRTFDLRHDPELAPFREAEQIEVAELSAEQVDETLLAAQAGTIKHLTPAVIKLLQTPLHLSIYCALDQEARNGEPATSLQELYDKLLQQYLLNPKRLPGNVGVSQVRTFLYRVAETMYQKQQLTLPRLYWEEEDTDVFNYLNTQAILNLVGPRSQQLTFFHQTFYEYLFAKQFVTKGQPLAEFVLTSGQGLFLRSLTQQVLVFLRGQDPTSYLRAIHQLLTSPACRFHVKLLITQFLATQPLPDAAELNLVRGSVLTNAKLVQPFIESVSHRPWLEYLTELTLFQQLTAGIEQLPAGRESSVPNTLLWVLARRGPELLLPRMFHLPAGPHAQEWIVKVLDDAGATTAREFTDLFAAAFAGELSPRQQFVYWKILQDQAKVRPDWVAEQAFRQLANAPFEEEQQGQHEDYLQSEAIKKLWESDRHMTFILCSRLLRTWIRRSNHYRNLELVKYAWGRKGYALLSAPHFMDREDLVDQEREPHSAFEAIQHYAWQYLRDEANLHYPVYKPTVKKWLYSRTDLLVNMALAAAAKNAAEFAPLLVRLFLKDGWFNGAADRSYTGCSTRRILPQLWDAITADQRLQLAHALTSRKLVADVGMYTNWSKERVSFRRYGRDSLYYLQVLGQKRLQGSHPPLATQLAEFTRRWGILQEQTLGSGGWLRSADPSPAHSWKVDKVTPANWLRALRKYRGKGEPDFWSEQGTYAGLCQHIKQLLKEKPADYIGLLTYLLDNDDESVAMILPELCETDPFVAASLVDLAYEKQLLTTEAYHRLRRKTATAVADGDQPLEVEFVQHDLETIRQNLNAECSFKLGDKNARRDLLTAVLNTSGARELYDLLAEKLPEAMVSQVIDVLHVVAKQGSLIARAAGAGHLAMLLRSQLPSTLVVELFQELVGHDYVLLAPGQWSLQYLVWREPAAVFRLLEAGMIEELAHETITRLLAVQWGHNTPGAHELLQAMWMVNPAMQPITLDQLTIGYGKWSNQTVVFDAMDYFLSTTMTKEMVRELDDVFRNLAVAELPNAAQLIERYIIICAPHIEYEHFLLDYLARCVTQYPSECIHSLVLLVHNLNKTHRRYDFKRNILKVLIEAYTRLPHQNAQNVAVQASLDLFDELLQDSEVRNDDLKEAMSEIVAHH